MGEITFNPDRLVRSTVRITTFAGEQRLADGSGLLMQLNVLGPANPNVAPVVVTNKQVVEDADWIEYQVPGSS
ncbi:hypothetical protein [uncultured Phenylobacterium sp.]|uniref:hypothetical protein n=1 Tax=uncultured Phenylobacterium sp. TaxID=349273 RepID=UPI0025FA97FA|nr:hypothetical protein [uncultured Phenylobacterium sp.]